MGQAVALTLGEGFEAFMIVALSLAYLRRTDRRLVRRRVGVGTVRASRSDRWILPGRRDIPAGFHHQPAGLWVSRARRGPLLPFSGAVHEATEAYSPDGRYGHFFPYAVVLIPMLWVGVTVLRGSGEDPTAGQMGTL